MMKKKATGNQPWIYSAPVDLGFVLLPSFFVFVITWSALRFLHVSNSEISPFAWLILIVGVDVSHVYSTLYRTYFDRYEFQAHKKLYVLSPLFCLVIAGMLAFWDLPKFWSIMAYMAIFHFIRQQYGFMRIYTRREAIGFRKNLASFSIYAVSIIPVLIWHVGPPTSFHWFMEGDLWIWPNETLYFLLKLLFWLQLTFYVGTELYFYWKAKQFNVPKNLLLAGTALAWYYGIVVNDGDLMFTALNVVSHGVPYMALVWIYGNKQKGQPNRPPNLLFRLTKARWFGIIAFVSILLVLALSEEFLWDRFIWHEHPELFGSFGEGDVSFLAWLFTAMLSVPQLTHYVLDGFIWKIRHDKHGWKETVLPS